MKNFKINVKLTKKILLPIIGSIMFSTLSFGNVGNKKVISNDLNPLINMSPALNSSTVYDPTAELEKAKKEGKTVFLLINGKGATDIDNAANLVKDVNSKVSKSKVVLMNRDDAANSSLVTKLGIAFVQVPFILVISPKGVAVAGFPAAQATSDILVKSVPSPKQDEVLFEISQKKPVFIVVSKKGLTDKANIIKNCKSASSKIATKPNIIEFDFNDSKESAFLKQLGVTSISNKTITVVVNSTGQLTDKFEGAVLESALTASVNKVIKSCCPGGSGKGCAGSNPSGCGQKK